MTDPIATAGAQSEFTVMLRERFASVREMYCCSHLLLEVLPVYYSRDTEIVDAVEILTVSRDLKIFVGTDLCWIL